MSARQATRRPDRCARPEASGTVRTASLALEPPIAPTAVLLHEKRSRQASGIGEQPAASTTSAARASRIGPLLLHLRHRS
jgi:hypothetical protein